jgi:hypothetical protein
MSTFLFTLIAQPFAPGGVIVQEQKITKSTPLITALQHSLDRATEPKLREQLKRLIASLKSKRPNKAA